MHKYSNSLYAILLLGTLCGAASGQTDAADAARVFATAEIFQAALGTPIDPPLADALDELRGLLEQGNRYLLNRNGKEARRIAEQVSAQVELIKLLDQLADLKQRLRMLQRTTRELQEQKSRLENQHHRLILLKDGRALTGAYPAFSATTEGISK